MLKRNTRRFPLAPGALARAHLHHPPAAAPTGTVTQRARLRTRTHTTDHPCLRSFSITQAPGSLAVWFVAEGLLLAIASCTLDVCRATTGGGFTEPTSRLR